MTYRVLRIKFYIAKKKKKISYIYIYKPDRWNDVEPISPGIGLNERTMAFFACFTDDAKHVIKLTHSDMYIQE